MQKTAKKFLAMLLAVVLALSMLPTAVFATESSDSGLMSIVPYGANDQTTGTATITTQDPVTFTGYATFEDVSHYHVTVPVGTTYVKATYKGVALQTNSATGEVSGYYADLPQWTGSGLQVAYTESNDEITVTIPLSYTMEGEDGTVQKNFVLNADGSGAAFAPEYDSSNNYAPVHFLTFGYAGNTAPTVAPNAITTANVAVGTEWTLDLADVFVDADGDTLTYTATVNDVAQTLTGSVLTYAPAAAGTYTVVLTASDNTGTATHTITLTAADAAMLPRLKDGVSATASATAAVGYAYNLTDLQTGKIFENPDGSSLDYTDYYYYRTVDSQRSGPYYFSKALFGATMIQITENAAGTYTYEFHAKNTYGDSADTWTLTLKVSNAEKQNYTFHVGRDMNYSTANKHNPVIKLYRTVGLDDDGADYIGFDSTGAKIYRDDSGTLETVKFWNSDFTSELDETEVAVTEETTYRDFYAALIPGRYSFRAYGYNTVSGKYDI